MKRYCPSCMKSFSTGDHKWTLLAEEKIEKTCAECGFGDCVESVPVNSSSVVPIVTPKDKPDQKDEKKDK